MGLGQWLCEYAYGKRTVLDAYWQASTTDISLGHQGLRLDGETGMYDNRARYYHPTLGRFIQRDPLGYVDGGSLYEYVGSNPTNRRDPSGLMGSLDGPHDALMHYLIGGGTDAWLSDGMVSKLKQYHFYRDLMQNTIPKAIQGLLPNACNIAEQQKTVSGVLFGILTAPIQPGPTGQMYREDFYSFELNNLIGTINSFSWTVTCTVGSSEAVNDEDGECYCLAYAKNCKVQIVLDDRYTFNTGIKDKLFQWTFGDFMGWAGLQHSQWMD